MNALKRRSLKKSGQEAKKLTPWKYEEEMSFLQPFLYNRDTQTNLGESSQHSQGVEESTSSQPSDDEVVFGSEELFQSSPKRQQGFKESSTPIKKKRSAADEMIQIMKANAEYRRLKSENKEQTDQNKFDESDMFYLSMSQQAKRLPALDQAMIKMELCNLMQQAEIRLIQANSCEQSNSTNYTNF